MKILFDETYTSKDEKSQSRNIWYGYGTFSIDGEYGKSLNLNQEIINMLCDLIQKDSSQFNHATEINWYFYGSDVTKDAIGDSIRPTIMIREKSGSFITNINISDYDFATNIDAILSFKQDLENKLNSCSIYKPSHF